MALFGSIDIKFEFNIVLDAFKDIATSIFTILASHALWEIHALFKGRQIPFTYLPP